MNEKRVSQRAPLEMNAAYHIPELGDAVYQVTLVNISKGGFCFTSTELLKENTEITLLIDDDDNDRIRISVKSKWCKKQDESQKYLVGVKITDASSDDFENFLTLYSRKIAKLQETKKDS